MRIISLTYFTLFFSLAGICQTINLKSNLSGAHRITYDESDQENIDLTADVFYKLNVSDTLEIEFNDNNSTIIFKFYNVEFHENDTLFLDFIHYYNVDTVNYSSSCIDGTNSESKTTYRETNKGFKTMNELPDSIAVKLSNRELICKKIIRPFVIVETGSGKKLGKRWGYSKSTHTKDVIYSFSNE